MTNLQTNKYGIEVGVHHHGYFHGVFAKPLLILPIHHLILVKVLTEEPEYVKLLKMLDLLQQVLWLDHTVFPGLVKHELPLLIRQNIYLIFPYTSWLTAIWAAQLWPSSTYWSCGWWFLGTASWSWSSFSHLTNKNISFLGTPLPKTSLISDHKDERPGHFEEIDYV